MAGDLCTANFFKFIFHQNTQNSKYACDIKCLVSWWCCGFVVGLLVTFMCDVTLLAYSGELCHISSRFCLHVEGIVENSLVTGG